MKIKIIWWKRYATFNLVMTANTYIFIIYDLWILAY